MSSDLAFYYDLFKKRVPVMSVIFLICAGLGVATALTLPPRYSADATLLVEGAQIPDELAISTVQTNAQEQLQIVEQRLMTRANLIDIARKFQVFAGEQNLTPDQVQERMTEQTEISLSGGRERATIMRISFTALSPAIAADVVNEFVSIVLKEDVEARLGRAETTLEFFEQEVIRLDTELSQRSAAIIAFKEANQDALPDNMEYRLERQAALQERLTVGAREIASLRDQKSRLQQFGTATTSDVSSISPDRQQLAAARANLSAELATLSENHPKVKNLRAKIQQLEARVEGGEVISDDSDLPTSTTATILKLDLAEIDSKIAFLEEEALRAEAELSALRTATERAPEVAIRLGELEREYQNTQAQYNQKVAARAQAQTGEQIEFLSRGERVSLIEQASVPDQPTSPNRKLIAGGGVFAGGALAGLFFVLTELLNRTIRRPIDLTRGLGVQPLATIPYIELPGERRKRRAIKTLVIFGLIASIAVALWVVHTQYLPLDLLFDRVIERIGV